MFLNRMNVLEWGREEKHNGEREREEKYNGEREREEKYNGERGKEDGIFSLKCC